MRQRTALAFAIGCAALSTGGLVASTLVKSPQQVAASSRAPEPSLVTSIVERRVLASTLVTRGEVVAGARLEVTPTGAQGAAVQVVTAVRVAVGAEIRPGQVLLAVSGRPLVVLPGAVPAYRGLKPGDSGPDVRQLQVALGRLGHDTGRDRPGTFGPATKTAVRSLYAKLGYDVPDTGGLGGVADRPALDAARAAVAAAQRDVDAMSRRIAGGPAAAPAEPPLSRQLSDLEGRLATARRGLADLVARTGPMLPLNEFVFVPAFPARVSALTAKVGDQVKAPLLTISAGRLSVRAKLRPDQAALLRPGLPVRLAVETLGQEVPGEVATIGPLVAPVAENAGSAAGGDAEGAPAAGPAGIDAPHHPMTVTPDRPLPTPWSGQDVRVTVTAARTGAPVLVVPLSAVSAGADARTTVSVVRDGRTDRVEVRAGVSGDGFVEVTPLGGALHEGERVVVSGP